MKKYVRRSAAVDAVQFSTYSGDFPQICASLVGIGAKFWPEVVAYSREDVELVIICPATLKEMVARNDDFIVFHPNGSVTVKSVADFEKEFEESE